MFLIKRNLNVVLVILLSNSTISLFSQNKLFIPDTLSGVNFHLKMDTGSHEFFAGYKTTTMGINGGLLGPTLFFKSGDSIQLNVENKLVNDPTTMHWHGLHVSPVNDGGPHNVINSGSTWSPSFTVRDRAGVYWYHPHLHMKTNEHVSKGVAGMIIVRDKEEAALNLPRTYGVNDIPVIIQTKAFNANREILVHSNSDSVVMVNGTINSYYDVGAEVIRLRVLNGSSQRSYNLGLSDNSNFSVIGSDGGLLSEPVALNRLLIAPGERYEILINFTESLDKTISLMSYASEIPNGIYGAANAGMGQNMTLTGYNPNILNGSDFNLLTFNVKPSSANAIKSIPSTLVKHNPWTLSQANTNRTITFTPEAMGPNQLNGKFLINGESFSMGKINYKIPFNNIEVWELSNNSGIAHPFHIHDVQFYIIEKNGGTPPAQEQGRKDVILVRPMQTVKFITKFETFHNDTVPYMYHCHLLTHEDDGMMGQFVVSSPSSNSTSKYDSKLFAIFPNPSSGSEINIKSNFEMNQVRISNLLGSTCFIKTLPNQKQVNLNINLPRGIYNIEISSNNRIQIQKLIVQ